MQMIRVVGCKNMSRAPVYRCLSRLEHTSKRLVLQFHGDRLLTCRQRFCRKWWVCVGGYVHKFPVSFASKFIKKKMMKKLNCTRIPWVQAVLSKPSILRATVFHSFFNFEPKLSFIFLCCLIYHYYFEMCHLVLTFWRRIFFSNFSTPCI